MNVFFINRKVKYIGIGLLVLILGITNLDASEFPDINKISL